MIRLTDHEIAALLECATGTPEMRVLHRAATELKERRAGELSFDEQVTMAKFKAWLCETLEPHPDNERAIAILSRLLANGGAK